MAKRRGPPSQGWHTFLRNHAPDIAAMDLFVVPTIGFDLLYAFVIVRLDRRQLVWVNVTTNPTAESLDVFGRKTLSRFFDVRPFHPSLHMARISRPVVPKGEIVLIIPNLSGTFLNSVRS